MAAGHMKRWDKAQWLVSRVERIAYIAAGMPPGSAKLLYKIGASKDL